MLRYKLFDIQRNSFVDGPGIRTTVFFRGCNLRCEWCHNPEGQSGNKSIFYYKDKCTKCGECIKACKQNAITPYGVIDYNKCNFCGECVSACPNDALELCGMDYSLHELFDIIVKDKPFYDKSGGGVTFSGGECMLYPKELLAILKRCRENKIHTAVDTAGNVPWENFKTVLPHTDLFLYDIKMMSSAQHKKYTGVENELILENLRKLFKCRAEVWVIIPVIVGVNNNKEEMQKVREYLKPYYSRKIKLLPYHRLGEGKYEALSMSHQSYSLPSKENMKELEEHMFY